MYGFGAPIVSVDESSIAHIPGARVVRKSDFLGVVAPNEYDAIQAAAQLKVKWADPPEALPGGGNEFAADASAGQRRQDGRAARGPRRCSTTATSTGALASAAHVVSAELRLADERPHPDRPAAARSPT